MLTKQRYDLILKLLEEQKSVTLTELKELLHTSESTVRRDIVALDKAGKLMKVFGGAVVLEQPVITYEPTVEQKRDVKVDEKRRIAAYAASLVGQEEFIYLDAGTTTGCLIAHLEGRGVSVVTNAVAHARQLAALGVRVYLVGGELKGTTEAVIGSQAVEMLQNYHFTKGFFGTNGITQKTGFTTPDANEAQVKKAAMRQCGECFVLADASKFDRVSSVTFAGFGTAKIITEELRDGYQECENILCVSDDAMSAEQ